jgi:hypothetical protein
MVRAEVEENVHVASAKRVGKVHDVRGELAPVGRVTELLSYPLWRRAGQVAHVQLAGDE